VQSVDRSIWALVAGNICGALIMALISHAWLQGISNRWQWDGAAFRAIIHFGKWIFMSSIPGFLVANGDRFLLGGLVNTTTLGVYVIAVLIVNSVFQVQSRIISDLSFPALSEVVRERPTGLKASYYRFHVILASFVYFCSGVLMISGQTLIALLYDSRYWQAGWMLEVLALALLTSPFRLVAQCFLALGVPRILSYISATQLITLFVALPIGFHYFGIPGALAVC
jgi:O-antigen/teichoic acid export membrane protein